MGRHLQIIFLIALTLSTVTNCNKTNFLWESCYRYGIIDDIIKSNGRLDVSFINKKDYSRRVIAYYQDEKTCISMCKKDSDYYKCDKSGYDYDKLFGIPDKVFVCWLKSDCADNSISAYKYIDKSFSSRIKDGCNYLCRAIYGNNNGLCVEIPGDKNNYQCMFK